MSVPSVQLSGRANPRRGQEEAIFALPPARDHEIVFYPGNGEGKYEIDLRRERPTKAYLCAELFAFCNCSGLGGAWTSCNSATADGVASLGSLEEPVHRETKAVLVLIMFSRSWIKAMPRGTSRS